MSRGRSPRRHGGQAAGQTMLDLAIPDHPTPAHSTALGPSPAPPPEATATRPTQPLPTAAPTTDTPHSPSPSANRDLVGATRTASVPEQQHPNDGARHRDQYRSDTAPPTGQHEQRRAGLPTPPPITHTSRCPTCHYTPATPQDRIRLRQDLATVWLYPHPHRTGQLLHRRHCLRCQPHEHIAFWECQACGDGPILAEHTSPPRSSTDTVDAAPPALRDWLSLCGWRHTTRGWLCRRHPAPTPLPRQD